MVYGQQDMGYNPYGFGGAFIPQGTGQQFNGYMGAAPTVHRNILTAEQIDELIKKENTFSLALTQADCLRAACNHRTADGSRDALVEEEDGVRCSICGYKFHALDPNTQITTKEQMQAVVSEMNDILQTIKLIWVDVNAEAAAEYFKVIPLLEKAPDLFEIAAKNFAKHGGIVGWNNNSYQMNAMQLFNMLSGIVNPAAGYQQPMGGAMPNPAMGANPVYQQPMGGMPNPAFMGGTNGFVMQPGYQPQTNGFQYGQPVAPVAPTPAAPTPAADAAPVAPTPADNTTAQTFKA